MYWPLERSRSPVRDGDPDVSLPSGMFFVALFLTSPYISARYLAFNRQSASGCKSWHFALWSFSGTGEFSLKVISLVLLPGAFVICAALSA